MFHVFLPCVYIVHTVFCHPTMHARRDCTNNTAQDAATTMELDRIIIGSSGLMCLHIRVSALKSAN